MAGSIESQEDAIIRGLRVRNVFGDIASGEAARLDRKVARQDAPNGRRLQLTLLESGEKVWRNAWELMEFGEDPTLCRWFLLCENVATGVQDHPILGDVPICDRCQAKVNALKN